MYDIWTKGIQEKNGKKQQKLWNKTITAAHRCIAQGQYIYTHTQW